MQEVRGGYLSINPFIYLSAYSFIPYCDFIQSKPSSAKLKNPSSQTMTWSIR